MSNTYIYIYMILSIILSITTIIPGGEPERRRDRPESPSGPELVA